MLLEAWSYDSILSKYLSNLQFCAERLFVALRIVMLHDCVPSPFEQELFLDLNTCLILKEVGCADMFAFIQCRHHSRTMRDTRDVRYGAPWYGHA